MDSKPAAAGNRSTPTKVGVTAVGAAGMAVFMTGLFPEAWRIIVIGMATVLVLVGLYAAIVHQRRKRQAKPFEQAVIATAGAGMAEQRAAGQDLYRVPWYALIGEPGSGKTEAMRHCDVPFPSGPGEELQAAGATPNVNWWLTSDAVILDTAGRLMFEEVEAGATSEWAALLGTLRQYRPHCPLSGVLLAIPADSVIRDADDDIKRKAAKLAEQLGAMQRALGVRFPVYVLVTKSDLISGFRDFFDDVTEPELQQQILGWSNPAALDEPFDADLVDQHLASVRQRLERRRLGLLLDPVHSEDPSLRRIDQVDALYAFPDSLTRIGPRLRRYLETIFAPAGRAAKPLFLRGVYFTSAVRQGAALDAALAEALDVPVESLPADEPRQRQGALFLGDVFTDKVFREPALVTDAGNTWRLRAWRRAVPLVATFVAVHGLLALAWLGARDFAQRIGNQGDVWASISQATAEDALKFIGTGTEAGEYLGDRKIPFDGLKKLSVAQLPSKTRQFAMGPVSVPWAFRWGMRGTGPPAAERVGAHRVVLENTILLPVAQAGFTKLDADVEAGTWSAQATAALAQLIRVETFARKHVPAADAEAPGAPIDLDAVLRYVLQAEAFSKYDQAAEKEALAQALTWTYSGRGGKGVWPPQVTLPAGQTTADRIGRAVRHFVTLTGQSDSDVAGGRTLADLQALHQALTVLAEAEDRVLEVDDAYATPADEPATSSAYDQVKDRWGQALSQLTEAAEGLDKALGALVHPTEPFDLLRLSDQARSEQLDTALRGFDRLLAQTPAQGTDAADQFLATMRAELSQGRGALERRVAEQVNQVTLALGALDRDYLATTPGTDEQEEEMLQRPYAVRLEMYRAADAQLGLSVPTPALDAFGVALDRVDTALADATRKVEALAATAPRDNARITGARQASAFVLRLAGRRRRYDLLDAVLRELPDSATDVGAKVEALVDRLRLAPVNRPQIPMTVGMTAPGTFDAQYHPTAAGHLLQAYSRVNDQITADGAARALEVATLRLGAERVETGLRDYAQRYFGYWALTVPRQADLAQFAALQDLQEQLVALNGRQVNRGLKQLGEQVLKALEQLPVGLVSQKDKDHATAEVERGLAPIRTFGPDFNATCGNLTRRWFDLAQNASAARLTVAQMTPQQFERDYLELYHEDRRDPGVPYWSDLCDQGLRLLADAAEQEARQAKAELVSDCKLFPLCRTADPGEPLRPDQARAAWRQAARIRAPIDPAAVGAEPTIGQGARTRFARADGVNAQLDRLTGIRVFSSDRQRQWLVNVALVLEAMATEPGLTAQLVLLPVADQEQRPAAGGPPDAEPAVRRFPFFGAQGRRLATDGQAAGEANITVELPGRALTVEFYRHLEADLAHGHVPLAAPWTALAAILGPGVTLDQDADGAQFWKVPLWINDSSDGKVYWYWVGFKFSRPLPSLDHWPSDADWPEAPPTSQRHAPAVPAVPRSETPGLP